MQCKAVSYGWRIYELSCPLDDQTNWWCRTHGKAGAGRSVRSFYPVDDVTDLLGDRVGALAWSFLLEEMPILLCGLWRHTAPPLLSLVWLPARYRGANSGGQLQSSSARTGGLAQSAHIPSWYNTLCVLFLPPMWHEWPTNGPNGWSTSSPSISTFVLKSVDSWTDDGWPWSLKEVFQFFWLISTNMANMFSTVRLKLSSVASNWDFRGVVQFFVMSR